ncbi:MAG TPA: hypothetical protein VK892_18115 [Pyrinomonadaceae bacterium]|nr:hypothetical protein [Pyrinomonadaceae bacterium]
MNNLIDKAAYKFKIPELTFKLNLTTEVKWLNEFIVNWIDEADKEIQNHLVWQLLATPKYFRPIFSPVTNPFPIHLCPKK